MLLGSISGSLMVPCDLASVVPSIEACCELLLELSTSSFVPLFDSVIKIRFSILLLGL